MAYSTMQIGITGPSGRIGSGTEFHIDSKYASSLPWEDIDRRFKAKADRYAQEGRNIVFSNQGVSGAVYNPNAPLEERISLLQRAASAHAPREGFRSFDYYAPIGTDRWDKSAEGAPIYVAGSKGSKAKGYSGGDYGNYAYVLDASGRVVGKSGHGDTAQAVFAGGSFDEDQSTTLPVPQANDQMGNVTVNNYYGDGTETQQKKQKTFAQRYIDSMISGKTKSPATAMIQDMMQSGTGKLNPLAVYNLFAPNS
jgi:hypothetical protein